MVPGFSLTVNSHREVTGKPPSRRTGSPVSGDFQPQCQPSTALT